MATHRPATPERVVRTEPGPSDGFARLVRDALRHLHDRRAIDRVPLVRTGSADRGPDGRALAAAIHDAIASLGAAGGRLTVVAELMRLRYLDGLPPPVVFRRLGISQSGYYRQHDRGVADVVEFLRAGWVVRGMSSSASVARPL